MTPNLSPICNSNVPCDDCSCQVYALNKNGKKTGLKGCTQIEMSLRKTRHFLGKDGSTYTAVKGWITKD